jgi:cytochrome c oxidase subunit II
VSSTTLAYLLLFSITSAIGVALAIAVAVSTRRRPNQADEPREAVERRAHFEKTWLFLAAGSVAVVLLFTIFLVPYGKSAGPDRQVVNVTGQQFAFVLQPTTVKAGTPVEFRLKSPDVTHGFAVFDPDGDFLFQAQVVPEHTQLAVHTFTTPGTHRIVCFEFCGLNHHNMLGQIEVTQ